MFSDADATPPTNKCWRCQFEFSVYHQITKYWVPSITTSHRSNWNEFSHHFYCQTCIKNPVILARVLVQFVYLFIISEFIEQFYRHWVLVVDIFLWCWIYLINQNIRFLNFISHRIGLSSFVSYTFQNLFIFSGYDVLFIKRMWDTLYRNNKSFQQQASSQ